MASSKFTYTQDGLEEAIGLVQSKTISLNAASKAFSIPLTTLADKVSGRRPVKAQSRSLLSKEEEDVLLRWILLCSARSMGRTHSDVKKKVKEILNMRGASSKRADGCPGRDWMISFKKRHPEISLRSPQSLGKERALVSADSVDDWLQKMKEYLDSKDPVLLTSPDRLYNADETGFSLSPNFPKVLAATGTKHVYNVSNNTKNQITVLCCVSAVGDYANPLLIYPRKRLPSYNLLDGFEDAFMQLSNNGWINASIFKTWIENVFLPFVEHKKKPVVLFVDGHASHNSDIDTLELCDKNGVILYGLLPHASHIIQPLDLTVFGSMKATWPIVIRKFLEETGETPSMANFSKLLKRVWDNCAKPEFALKGFIKSGIYPFKPQNPLFSGKMETEKVFSTSTADPPSLHPEPVPETICSAIPAHPTPPDPDVPSTTVPAATTTSYDNVEDFILLTHKIGLKKSNDFLEFVRNGKKPSPKEEEFGPFQKLVQILGSPTTPSNSIVAETPVSSRPHQGATLHAVLQPPTLPRNKSGKGKAKTPALTMAFSGEQYRQYLKDKETQIRDAEEEKENRKLEREKKRQRVQREKEEKQVLLREKREKLKVERERKAREKKMKADKKKFEKVLKEMGKSEKAKRKKNGNTSDGDGDDVEMVLESDREDVEMELDSSKCRICEKEEGDSQ